MPLETSPESPAPLRQISMLIGQWIGRMDLANGNAAYAFGSIAGSPVDMLVGPDGALYVLTTGGSITRFSAP